ncbi:MAG TPA: hypothetical protein VFF07_01380 [Actinomycetota bacterium]|nr:hypothetical protein [Actinomycetota bacterium]
MELRDTEGRTPLDEARQSKQRVAGAAMLAGAASIIHASVIGEHFGESILFGLFFAVATAFQLLWAPAALTWPRRGLLIVGAAGNAAIMLVWLASRSVGLPVGPEPWSRETVALPDLLATIFEGGVVLLVASLRSMPPLQGEVLIRRLGLRFRAFAVVLFVFTVFAVLRGH